MFANKTLERKTHIFLLICLMFILIQCKWEKPDKQYHVHDRDLLNIVYHSKSDWDSISPIELLLQLKEYPHVRSVEIGVFPDSSWFEEKYIPLISAYLSDSSDAAFVYSTAESNIHDTTMVSKTYVQAKYLLEAFKTKKYPPTLCSYHYVNN